MRVPTSATGSGRSDSSGSLPPLLRRVAAAARGASLDAVAVVLAGQWAVARWAGVPLPLEAGLFLAVGIWLGYSADRLADLRRTPELARLTARHAFHKRHALALGILWVTLFMASWPAALLLLPPRTVVLGACLAAAAALYVLAAHGRGHTGWKRGATVALLTGAVLWWPLSTGWAGTPQVWGAGAVFAVGAALNLAWLGRARGGGLPPGGGWGTLPPLERAALRADGLLLVVLLILGALAP